MWKSNQLTQRLTLDAPIVQGPFGSGLSAVDLVVAVSESGGLGSFGVHHLDGAGIRQIAAQIRERTRRTFALNLWIPLGDSDEPRITDAQWKAACELLAPWYDELRVPLPQRPARFGPRYEEQIETLIELAPPVFSFVFGVPSPDVLSRCRSAGIATLGAATTADEAKLLADAGVDMVVATGFEAGGHRVSFLREPEDCLTGTLALIPQVLDAVKVPVIAAGGMADGRGIAAALTAGAQAAQIGTAFLACEESNASPLHRAQLFSADARRTTLTRAFTGRLARSVHNDFIEAMRGKERMFASYPVQAWLTAQLKSAALAAGRADVISLWSGQGAPLLKHRRAAELFRFLVEDTHQAMQAPASGPKPDRLQTTSGGPAPNLTSVRNTEEKQMNPTDQPFDTDVLIVGAGPTGLALATTLKRRGAASIVVDRLPMGQNQSRAAVIHAHTLEVLAELGVTQRMESEGLKLSRFTVRDRDRQLVRLDFDKLPSEFSHLLMLPQDRTEQILRDALGEAGERVEWDSKVASLEQIPGGVEAVVHTGAGRRTIRARYVVGADGVNSIVRKTAGIGFSGHNYEDTFVLADVDMEWDHGRDEVMLFLAPEGLLVVAPLPGGRFRLVAILKDAPEKPQLADVQALLDSRGPTRGGARVTQVFWSSRFRLQHRVADHYRKGRLLLVGDAAHAHSPAGGQGMNTGLVDATLLGKLLAEVVGGTRDDSYLDRYEALRRPAAEEVLALAGRLTAIATVKGRLARRVRNVALGIVGRLPPVRRKLQMALSGLSRRSAAQAPAR